jgi:hypothetical protein
MDGLACIVKAEAARCAIATVNDGYLFIKAMLYLVALMAYVVIAV